MKTLLIVLSLLLLAGCGRESVPAPEVPAEIPAALSAVFQPVPPPADPVAIPGLRTRVAPGDEVVFEAKVMGTETPFIDGRALVVVGDEGTLDSCDVMEGDDHCRTPWDVCCEDREEILNGTVTVQVVDENGKVLPHGLKGVNGLKELSRLRIKGTVAPMSTAQALIVNATAIELL